MIEQERREARQRRQQEEDLDRIEREPGRRLGRGMRREVLLHQRGREGIELEERGDRVIADAIRDERMRREEEAALHAEPFRRGRLGRRRIISGGRERIIYEDELARPRWRWI